MLERVKYVLRFLLGLIPIYPVLFIWIFMNPLSERFANPESALLSLGRTSGIFGFALFAISLAVSNRIRLWDFIVGRANITKFHHDISSLAFIFMLLHPIMLAIRYALSSVDAAANLLLPFDRPVILYGFIALAIVITVMLVTYYYKKNHKLWLWIHRALLIAFPLALLHMIFVQSDTSNSLTLKIYLLLISILGITGFAYQRISLLIAKNSTHGEVK